MRFSYLYDGKFFIFGPDSLNKGNVMKTLQKKQYEAPSIEEIKLIHQTCLLDESNEVTDVDGGDTGIGYGGGGSGGAL